MIDLFAEQTQELEAFDRNKVAEWSDIDLKNAIKVTIRDTAEPEKDRVFVKIGGTTPVKLFNNKGSRTIAKGSLTEEEALEQIMGLSEDKLMPVLRNAHKSLLTSLHKAKLSKAAKVAKAKRLKREKEAFLSIQKQEEQLKVEVNLARLQREQDRANISIGSK
jgi:hypothetical protein